MSPCEKYESTVGKERNTQGFFIAFTDATRMQGPLHFTRPGPEGKSFFQQTNRIGQIEMLSQAVYLNQSYSGAMIVAYYHSLLQVLIIQEN